MNDEHQAVFLSYASQDAEAAKRICDALREAGVEVWFDQSELVGGDSWDAKIRGQISSCALFVPLISANTQARLEGYFRLEWKLAAQRTHTMADEKTFLLPVVVDATRDAEAKVPGEFKTVQWTKLLGGETPEKFCERVKALLAGEVAPASSRPSENAGKMPAPLPKPKHPPSRSWSVPAIIGAALLVALAAYFALRPRRSPEEIAKIIASAQTIAADAAAKSTPAAPAAPTAPAAAGFPRDPELKRAWNLFLNTPNNTTEDFGLAEDIVKAAATRRPTDAEVVIVYAWLNDTYINRGFDLSEERYVLGRRYAERALQLAPEDPEALAAFGQFLSFRGADPARAEQLLRHAIELNPHEPRFYRALAYNVLRGPHPAEALQLQERAAELFPQDPLVLYELGVQYRDAGRIDDMEHAFDRSLALAPIGAAMIWKAWIAAWVHGDVATMKHWLDELPSAVRLSDRALIVRYEAACLTRDPAELAVSVRSLQAFPGSALRDFWYTGPKALLLGDLYAAQGQPELAKGQYELALAEVARQKTATPADLNVLIAETSALVGLGRREEALAAMRMRVSLMLADGPPRSVAWWFGAVPACLLLGDRTDALPLVKRISATAALRNQVRIALRIDPRMTAWRDDAEINALIAEPKEETAATVGVPAKADDKSVAVLAFADLSAAHDSEYFSDGISEELLNVLAKVPGLKVTARTSSFFFKGKNLPIPEIAAKLGVAYVIEGSVQRAGDNVRITAQLIKAADGFHVWSDHFDRELKNVFALQDEIAGLIAQNLSLKLGTSSAVAKAPVNPQAFELYVRGRQAWNLRTKAGFERAEELLNRALALEPNFVRAQAALADVTQLRAIYAYSVAAFGQRNSPEFTRIRAQIGRVLELDPELAEAHASLGVALDNNWDHAGGEREQRRAIALNPNYASAHHWLGLVLFSVGQIDEGLAETKLSTELDPLSPAVLGNGAWALHGVGRYREALTFSDRALALQPNTTYMLVEKALTFASLGRFTEAVALARQLPADDADSTGCQILVLGRAGLKAEAEALLAKQPARCYWPKYYFLLAVGQREAALAALEDLSATKGDDLMQIYFDPLYDTIRDEPRFNKFLTTLGATEAHARAQAWRKAHPAEKPDAK